MLEEEYKQKIKKMEAILGIYEQRLRVLEDIQIIQNLHYNYIYWVNVCDWDKIIDLFTEDCSVDIGPWGIRYGKGSLPKLFKEDIGHNNQGVSRDGHVASMPVISVDKDQAVAKYMLYIMMSDPVKGNRWLQGRHEVVYRNIEGKWKIHSISHRRWPTPNDEITYPHCS